MVIPISFPNQSRFLTNSCENQALFYSLHVFFFFQSKVALRKAEGIKEHATDSETSSYTRSSQTLKGTVTEMFLHLTFSLNRPVQCIVLKTLHLCPL